MDDGLRGELSLLELNQPALDGAMPARIRQAKRDLLGGHNMIGLRRIAVWANAIFLALAFVSIGISKLQGTSALRWSERFEHWGYPGHAQYVVAVLEILGGIALLIPRWRHIASVTLGALMIGALCTHLVNAEFARIIPPFVLGGLAFLTYRTSRARDTERSG
jgi:uncharacterized membrane protein YphA (DoxX/SURF4 family)